MGKAENDVQNDIPVLSMFLSRVMLSLKRKTPRHFVSTVSPS